MYEPEKILVQNAGIDPFELDSNECRQQTVYLSAN